MEIEKAKEFIREVRKHAKTLSLNGTAKTMNISLPAFNARLLKALTKLKEPPPVFCKRKTKTIEKVKVQPSGKGGNFKKIAIPQVFFDELGFKIGDAVNLRVSNKKLVIEKEESNSTEQ